jgi:MFS transporter, DHA3 family, macrolide efflux protein
MLQRMQLGEMQRFLVIWFGQMISLVGSGLTAFALGIWVYEQSNSVAQLTLISLFTTLPGLFLGPVAGTFVDRWNRRTVLIISELLAGLVILLLAILFFSGQLVFWQICLGVTINSLIGAFHWPAYYAVTPLLVPGHHLGRASGLTELAYAVSQLIAPVLGGVLFVSAGMTMIFVIDAVSFFLALGSLFLTSIPEPERDGSEQHDSFWRQAWQGWAYIAARPGLMALQVYAIFTRFVMGVVNVLATPLVLAFASASTLGTILSIGGIGGVIGSVLISTWGGPRRRVYGVLGAELIGGVCVLIAGLQPSVLLFGAAIFVYFVRWPIGLACNQTIWLSKVAPNLQGRVSSIRRLVGFSALPLSYLVAGTLVDPIFEPLLAPGGALAGSVGRIIGVGPGRGIGFLFVLLGLFTIVVTIIAFLYPQLRLVETQLPDMLSGTRAGDPAAAAPAAASADSDADGRARGLLDPAASGDLA